MESIMPKQRKKNLQFKDYQLSLKQVSLTIEDMKDRRCKDVCVPLHAEISKLVFFFF